jgi:hypothetical protein
MWYRLSPLNIIYKDKPTKQYTEIRCKECGQVVAYDEVIPQKRVYTAEQIQEAKDIVYRIMTNLIGGVTIDFLFLGKVTKCVKLIYKGNNDWTETESAKVRCSDGDEYNRDIGMMVAICKLTGTDCPSWVRGK